MRKLLGYGLVIVMVGLIVWGVLDTKNNELDELYEQQKQNMKELQYYKQQAYDLQKTYEMVLREYEIRRKKNEELYKAIINTVNTGLPNVPLSSLEPIVSLMDIICEH
jgi:Tfp pilus assembly protein PilO